jgi:protocatechuate 3,4-dioxygenase beta subunit
MKAPLPSPALARRSFFLKGLAGASGLVAWNAFMPKSRQALAGSCGLTAPQTEGPFYPGQTLIHASNDLTRVPGRPQRALGQLIQILGKVTDENCRPVAGATVEIWQACASGRYNNPKDTNPAPLDPDFRYWGEAHTDADGEYTFRTIRPGAYPADVDWDRPPHIHFKVSRLGFHELTTQMYFRGQPLNEKDLILGKLSASQQAAVIVEFSPSPGEPGSLTGSFDIALRSVR